MTTRQVVLAAAGMALVLGILLFGRFVHEPPVPVTTGNTGESLVAKGLRLALDAAQARETAALRRAQLALDSLAIARKAIAVIRVREQAHDDSARAAWRLADSLERQLVNIPDSTRRLIGTLWYAGRKCTLAFIDCRARADTLASQVGKLETRVRELVALGSRCGLRVTANGPGGGVLLNGRPVLLLGSITVGSCRLR